MRYTVIKDCTSLTLLDNMILSSPRPRSRANRALCSADFTRASRVTAAADSGWLAAAFSSIISCSSA